jgi:hypothetical protein
MVILIALLEAVSENIKQVAIREWLPARVRLFHVAT